MNDEMDEIISEFITEAEESLDRIEPLFVELEQKGMGYPNIKSRIKSLNGTYRIFSQPNEGLHVEIGIKIS